MPLTPHAITNYNEVLREQIMDGEGFEGEVYYNNGDTPTIGYGLALYDKDSGAKYTKAIDELKNAGVSITKEDEVIFNDIEKAMQASPRNDTTISKLVKKLSLKMDPEQGKLIFNNTIGHYESLVEKKLEKELGKELERNYMQS